MQTKYITNLLALMHMLTANLVATPMAPNALLHLTIETPLENGSEYMMVVGTLQYLLLTRPYVAFAINMLSQFMHRPTYIHWQTAKRVLRYRAHEIKVLSSAAKIHIIFMYSPMLTGHEIRMITLLPLLTSPILFYIRSVCPLGSKTLLLVPPQRLSINI